MCVTVCVRSQKWRGSHFWAAENGHFWHFQVPKNGTSSAWIQNLRPLFHANIPPKWWNRCLFYSFAIFECVSVKRAFSTKWWPGEENAPKIIFFFGLLSYRYNIYQVRIEFWKNFLIFWCTLIITLGFYLKYKPSFTFYSRHNLLKLTIACIWRWWFSGAAASWNFTLVQKLHGLRSCWRQYVFVPYWGGNGCHWEGGRRVWWQGIQDGKSSHQVSYSNNILLPLCLWQCF